MTTPNPNTDRARAFAEIKDAMTLRIQQLGQSKIGANGYKTLPEFVEAEEMFRWPSVVLYMAVDLAAGKSLQHAFNAATGGSVLVGRAPQHSTSRAGAFNEIRAALNEVMNDFDSLYRPLSREEVRTWQRQINNSEEQIKYAHKAHKEHYMQESIGQILHVLDALEQGRPAPVPRANFKP